MAIETVKLAQYIANLQKPSGAAPLSENIAPFESFLKDAVQQTMETDATTQIDAVNLTTGNSDSPHSILINAAKADLAVQMLVSVRNKAMDAYNEIMRITL
jgi:flagellar hook-basal body complex protein FliE